MRPPPDDRAGTGRRLLLRQRWLQCSNRDPSRQRQLPSSLAGTFQYQRFFLIRNARPDQLRRTRSLIRQATCASRYRPCCAAHIQRIVRKLSIIRETPEVHRKPENLHVSSRYRPACNAAYDRSVVARPPADRAPENHSSHLWKSRYGEQSLLRRAIG